MATPSRQFSMIEMKTFQRSALIGPFQEARLSGVDEAVNISVFLEELPRVNVPDLWLSTIIQSGVETLELIGEYDRGVELSPFASKRLSFRTPEEFAAIFLLIDQTFRHYFPNLDIDKDSVLFHLKVFLVELLLAARLKGNMVTLSELPEPKALESRLPPELLLPIKCLLSGLQTNTPCVPSIRQTFTLQDIELFEEILSSRLFRQYEDSHGSLEDSNILLARAVESIGRKSRKLADKYPRLLRLKRVIVSALPLSSPIIESVFGKLPGKLAEFCTSLLSEWLEQERRLVVYQFDDLLEATMRSRMHQYLEKKLPKEDSQRGDVEG